MRKNLLYRSFSHSFNRHLLNNFYMVDSALTVRIHKSSEHQSCKNSAPITVQHGKRTVLELCARAALPGRAGQGIMMGGSQPEQTRCPSASSTGVRGPLDSAIDTEGQGSAGQSSTLRES